MKVKIKVVYPDTLADDASICGLDAELLAMADAVQLNSRDAEPHLGVEDTRQRLEVEEEDEENEAADMFADHGLMWADMLEVE